MQSFPPIADANAKILILGSMPGNKSLEVRQYYAHPQNAFWWLMSQLFNFDNHLEYTDRLRSLQRAGIALWDVLACCEREGSLDSNIKRRSEKTNDLPAFLTEHKQIHCIGFNGGKAQEIFYRHFSQSLLDKFTIRSVLLPSTSPANARMTKQQKLAQWRGALVNENV